ncbi:hypothetical protein J6590_024397 [Homalodisca vitripennis]|nr:hypothetical protein J6590_024397 [Homalodisca vitripennis]
MGRTEKRGIVLYGITSIKIHTLTYGAKKDSVTLRRPVVLGSYQDVALRQSGFSVFGNVPSW